MFEILWHLNIQLSHIQNSLRISKADESFLQKPPQYSRKLHHVLLPETVHFNTTLKQLNWVLMIILNMLVPPPARTELI